MMKKQLLALALLCASVASLSAARIDTLLVPSAAMKRTICTVVITPDTSGAASPAAYPVVYLLNGFGGNAFTWPTLKPDLPALADRLGMLFVCPDGNNSWYWDSPADSTFRFETFIATELVHYIDTHYPTIATRAGRAITGLSMGGHGALWNALRHKQVFGAAGSTSGGVDIRPFDTRWNIARLLGSQAANQEVWNNHTVVNQIETLANGELALIIDCGRDDFFYTVNLELHHRLVARAIEHDFISRPGGHTATYWNNAIDYQLLFFAKFFAPT